MTRRTAPDILDAAKDHLVRCAVERDSPEGERTMWRAVEMFNIATGHKLSERDGNVFMICLKTARACTTPAGKPDDYEDGAAYFGLAGESA